MLERLLASPPEKFLELGAYHLLTGYFQGGRDDSVFVTKEKQSRNEPGRSDTSPPNLKRTRVYEDEGKATTKNALAVVVKDEETISDDGDS